MNKILLIITLIFSLNNYSQNKNIDCENLVNGTFEIFDKGKKIATIYRKYNFQIEKYINQEKLTFGKFKYNKCTYSLNSLVIKEKLDTLTWLINYKKIKNKHYKYVASPKYLKIAYKDEADIIKIDDKVSKEMEERFCELKKKQTE